MPILVVKKLTIPIDFDKSKKQKDISDFLVLPNELKRTVVAMLELNKPATIEELAHLTYADRDHQTAYCSLLVRAGWADRIGTYTFNLLEVDKGVVDFCKRYKPPDIILSEQNFNRNIDEVMEERKKQMGKPKFFLFYALFLFIGAFILILTQFWGVGLILFSLTGIFLGLHAKVLVNYYHRET